MGIKNESLGGLEASSGYDAHDEATAKRLKEYNVSLSVTRDLFHSPSRSITYFYAHRSPSNLPIGKAQRPFPVRLTPKFVY